jgi:hypothetical protein
MVSQPTEYRKRQRAIQEAYFAEKHLRNSKGKPPFMNAQNKWSRARKVMKQADFVRVSCRAVALLPRGNAESASIRKEISGRVNALEAFSRNGMKQTLNAVVEVKYTTDRLEVAGWV